MRLVCRVRLLIPVLVVGWTTLAVVCREARAQFGHFGASASRYELAETVQLDRADSNVAAALERARASLAERQWDEAIQTLRQVMENSGEKLWAVTEHRYMSVRDYCHLQLAALPPEALVLYRSQLDPLARKWYEEGVASRDRRRLLDVLNHAFAGSWGDDALLALGEMALERGDFASARAYWEKIIPVDPPPDAPRTWLCFPDTNLDLAGVRARLILVSILEGSTSRADDELAAFARLHRDARGRLGGREVNYLEELRALLAESAAWPRRKTGGGWPTFAGSPWRNHVTPAPVDVGRPAWRIPLRRRPVELPAEPVPEPVVKSAAGDARSPLSFHPVLWDNLVLVNNRTEIMAVDVRTGEPAWGQTRRVIYRDQFHGGPAVGRNPFDALGIPRFTMTAFDGKLYARMGSTLSGRVRDSAPAARRGYLVCVDLKAEGRLVWKIEADGPGWTFEGSPLCDGTGVYVAVRRADIRPQAHVACYDAETGRLRWRRFVCAAETPARGVLPENTHNLLTLRRETIYYNTNLGAVAAVSTADGRVRWISLYPRVRSGDLLKPEPHTARDLNPCVYHRGTLLVAPADSRRIFALDAATGQILWQTGSQVEDVVHLLGVAADRLIAAGGRLYWISLKADEPGKLRHVWPEAQESLGYGRGLLAGDSVYWPTREKIYVFDQTTARLKKVIELGPKGATGGNLLVADGRLLIANDKELIALAPNGRAPSNKPTELSVISSQ